MDHVNIISKEAITMMAPWISNVICIFGFSMIIFLIGCLAYSSLSHNKKLSNEKYVEVIKEANEKRENGVNVLVVRMNKNKKFQKEQLKKEGYEEFKEFFAD